MIRKALIVPAGYPLSYEDWACLNMRRLEPATEGYSVVVLFPGSTASDWSWAHRERFAVFDWRRSGVPDAREV